MMFKKRLVVESGEIKYTLKSNDDSQILEAHHTNIYKSQLTKWSISINPQNYKQLINIEKNKEQVDWLEVHSIIEQIFNKFYSAKFLEDHSQSSLKIECIDNNVIEFLGSFVIELPRIKEKSMHESFNKLEDLLRGEKEGPLNHITDKIMSRINKLSHIFAENRELIIQLEKDNEDLKKENSLLKEQLKKEQEESLEQEDYIVIEELPNKDFSSEGDVQYKMVEIMQKQLEKLDSISQQISLNHVILEKELKIKKKSRDEKLIHRESKYNRIRGMGNSFLPNKELFFLKKFLKEAGLLENDKTVLNCIYTASKNGYSASDFHYHCDFKPRNLVLIKANDFYFGGYTPCHWGSKLGWVDNKETFIFSLSNPHNLPIKMNCKNSQKSIYDYTSFGVIFGGGSDIYISDNCNQNTNSYSDLGYTFEGCPFSFSTKEAKSFLCGANNFKVQDIEVYQIIN